MVREKIRRVLVFVCCVFTLSFAWAAAIGLVTVSVYHIQAQTKIAPAQIRNATTFTALACIAPGTANADCAGLVYIDAVTPAGTSIKVIGFPPDSTFVIDPAKWTVIP